MNTHNDAKMVEFLDIDTKNLHFSWHPGDGERAVVFINSLGTDLRIWDDVVSRMPTSIPHFRYDKCGHGLSTGESHTITEFAGNLASLLDHVGISDALICAVSIGGLIAQELASQRSDLVSGLLLSNTSYRIGDNDSWESRLSEIDKLGIELIADDIMKRWFSPRFSEVQQSQLLGYRTMLVRTPIAGYRAACTAIRDANLETTSAKLKCPTLCIAGSDDQATPEASVRSLAKLIPNAEYLCFDQVGHLPCIEVPDKFTEALLEFHEKLS
ncbi:MAG: 3-oxoadipate enol-lactonase [Pseudomonadota bacterium]